MSEQEAEIRDIIEVEIGDMIDGTVANLVQWYLAIESLARDEVLLVEVELEMEIEGHIVIIPLTQTWSWVPGDGDGVAVQQLMEDDAAERFY